MRDRRFWLLAGYAVAADLAMLFLILPFQRYALVTARSDESTPATVLMLLLVDLAMLGFVMSGMVANGALLRAIVRTLRPGQTSV